MTHYIGLDAHSKTCTAVVVDPSGKIEKQAQFETSEKKLLEFVRGVGRPRKLAFEEMNLAQWLFLLLGDQVDDLAIAHAAHLPKQRGPKNDLRDAMRLADELRTNKITRVFHEDSPLWDLRVLVYSYLDFTADLVRAKNRYKAFLRARGHFVRGQGVYTDRSMLANLVKEHDRFVAANMFEHIARTQEAKDSYEARFALVAKQLPVVRGLCTIPGISTIRAAVIVAIVCTPHRFANKHKFWAYAMLVRYVDESDGCIYGSRKVHGRHDLKCVFMGAATAVLMGTSALRRYYDRLRSKGVADRAAKKSVARRVAAIALTIMKTGKHYDDRHVEKRRRSETSKTR
jgi:transposase